METKFSARSLEVVAPQLAQRIASGRDRSSALLQALTEQVITDEIGFFGPNRAHDALPLTIGYDGEAGEVAARVGDGNWRTFHKHAVSQLGERLSIPGAWVNKQMAGNAWQRESIADLLSTHLANTTERDRFLVRSVEGEIRGVLSDAYRRLSSPQIALAFQEAITTAGAVPYEASVTDLKWHVRAILPQPIELHSRAHGTEYVGTGLRISSSDFGAGALDLQAEILRLRCINGSMGESIINVVHLGARLPANLRFSEDTYRKDTEVQCSALREALPQLMLPAHIQKTLEPLEAAMETEVDAREVVTGLVRAARITKTQAAEVERLVMNRDGSIVPEGPVTRWTMAQAVSALANNDTLDMDAAVALRKTAQRITIGS